MHCHEAPELEYKRLTQFNLRQPVGCLQTVVELNFTQQNTNLAVRGQGMISTRCHSFNLRIFTEALIVNRVFFIATFLHHPFDTAKHIAL